MLSKISLALAAVPLALAASHDVQVGAGGALQFTPSSLTGVADGDVINFIFNPQNHTVTQSTFNTPCAPTSGGFDTGFVPVTSGTTTKSFTIPSGASSSPLWFFCGQTTHCQRGMVFAINAPTGSSSSSSNTFDAFQQRAMGVAGVTTSDAGSATATPTLGSHNPSTASGSVFTAASVADGATGSVTNADKPTTTDVVLGSTTLAGSATGPGAGAATATGKTSGAAAKGGDVSARVRETALAVGAVFFALGYLGLAVV